VATSCSNILTAFCSAASPSSENEICVVSTESLATALRNSARWDHACASAARCADEGIVLEDALADRDLLLAGGEGFRLAPGQVVDPRPLEQHVRAHLQHLELAFIVGCVGQPGARALELLFGLRELAEVDQCAGNLDVVAGEPAPDRLCATGEARECLVLSQCFAVEVERAPEVHLFQGPAEMAQDEPGPFAYCRRVRLARRQGAKDGERAGVGLFGRARRAAARLGRDQDLVALDQPEEQIVVVGLLGA